MSVSYRIRQRLRRFFTALAVIILAALVIYLVWLVWVGRYVVYTQGGAKLDFSLSPTFPSGQEALPPPTDETVRIVYDELSPEETTPPTADEQEPISGYYIDLADLKTDIPGVQAQLESLSPGTAVLLDLKDPKGHFYYPTSLGQTASDIDIDQMSALIEDLLSSDLYVIGRIPAFRDWAYGLTHVDDGLPKVGAGGALWWDEDYCYWLDPTAQGTIDYLTQIVLELRLKGFDEVVFTEFRFPDTDQIVFEGSRSQALADAAAQLAANCATDRFCLSFASESYDFPLPEGNCRLYLENVPAAEIHNVVDQALTDQPEIHLLFLTTVNDTRFDEYCVLRPLSSAY